MLLIFALLSGAILGLGYLYYEYQLAFFQRAQEAELNIIADLKVKQIVDWRKERMHDALLVKEDPIFAHKVKDWFAGRGGPEMKEEILDRLEGLKQDFYVGIALFDLQGLPYLSIPGLKPELLPLVKPLVWEAITSNTIIFSDLYPVPNSDEINMTLAVPLYFHRGPETILVGAVVYQIDPHHFLYPILQSWPTPSETGELVMVRRENEHEILFLNELRSRKAAPLTLRQSLAATHLPAVKAALGQEGIVQGLDYHGAPVLAANRKIPDSPWFLTAKVDLLEVVSPFKRWSYLIPMVSFALIATAGLSIALVWRQRETDFYRQQLETEREKETVLKESETQLRFLSSQLLIVQEQERSRISRELHDELGQTLMFLKFQLNRLSKEKNNTRAELHSLVSYLDGMIENVRRLSWDLSPACLEQFGLATAVKNLLEEFGEQIKIRWSADEIDGLDHLFSSLAQVNIYRIFQESLTNIGRHAQASEISVSLKKQEDHVLFSVADNGKGFDLNQVRDRQGREKGIGLAAMQERARLAGGFLEIWSQPGVGTKISFTIPVEQGGTSNGALSDFTG